MKTVGQLIAELQEFDPALPVFQSRDPEGNGYYTYSEAYEYFIDKTDLDDAYELDSVYSSEDLEDEDENPDDFAKILVLWP